MLFLLYMEQIYKQNNIEKEKFPIKPENIIALEEIMHSPERKELFQALNWPLEVQGSGRIIEGNEFEIRYPKGDIFFSYAAIIHELGHLRQDEKMEIGSGSSRNIEKEKDAFSRGWERLEKYCPEMLQKLEKEFNNYKNENRITNFDSFQDLYSFFRGTTNINQTLESLEESSGPEKEIAALKEIKIDDFFAKINNNKVGTIIDTKEANEFIVDMCKHIARE